MAGVLALTALLLGAACTSTAVQSGPAPSGSRIPPVPAIPPESLGASQPPLIWVGGTLSTVATDRLQITEPFGSVVTLKRLGRGATAFFRVSGGEWQRLAESSSIGTGAPVCAETLLDGTNLLALRVFLGAGCGPA